MIELFTHGSLVPARCVTLVRVAFVPIVTTRA